MITYRKLEVGLFLAALLLGSLFLRGWMNERGARNDADAYARQAGAKTLELGSALKTSQAEDAAYRAGTVDTARGIATPEQAAKIIAQYLSTHPAQPALPVGAKGAVAIPAMPPIPIVARAELSAAVLAELPAAPSYAILTPAETVAIAKNDLACDADRHSLGACSQQLVDWQKLDAIDKGVATNYKQALHGGTIFQRVGRVLRSAACAGAGAAIGSAITRGAQTQYAAAAVGGAGGVVACSMF